MKSEIDDKSTIRAAEQNRHQENVDIGNANNWSATNNTMSSMALHSEEGRSTEANVLGDLTTNISINQSLGQQATQSNNGGHEHHFASHYAYDYGDDDVYSHVSDEELTKSDIAHLRGTRNRLWGTNFDLGLQSEIQAIPTADKKKTKKPKITTAKKTLPTAASATSAASAAAAAKATKPTKAARKMARKAIATTTLGKTDMLNRFLKGSTHAPRQLLSWVSSSFSTPEIGSAATNPDFFDINDPGIFQPTARSFSLSTLHSQPTLRSSLSTSVFHTLPNSYGGSINASSAALTSTNSENIDPAEHGLMSAGTLFERGPSGNIVPMALADEDEDFDEAEGEDYEVLFNMDKETASKNEPGDAMEDSFCVLAPAAPSI